MTKLEKDLYQVKYYDKELPVEVHVVYGGRYSGRTYREFKRLKTRIKRLEEENKFLIKQRDNILHNNGDAARYIIANCISKKTGRISDPDILEIYKLLSGGGEPSIEIEEE